MGNNKLIAEFMGEVSQDGYYKVFNKYHIYLPQDMEYHTSWDWLMPVIKKIQELGCVVLLRNFPDSDNVKSCVISNERYTDIKQDKDLIIATYEAIVKFIKWYNKQKGC